MTPILTGSINHSSILEKENFFYDLVHQSQVKVFGVMSRAFSGNFERFLLSG
jgi:hypothetical protein